MTDVVVPEQEAMPIMLDHVDVRLMEHGMDVRQVFVVRNVTQREKQNGDPYLQIVVGDRTGSLELMVWPVRNSPHDEVARVKELANVGALLAVRGKVEVHPQYGTRLKVHEESGRVGIKCAQEGEYDPNRLVQGPRRPVEDIEVDLRALVATTRQPLRDLLDIFFHDADRDAGDASPFYAAFRDAPAAKGVHQPYRHGLLEHTVGLAQAVRAVAETQALGKVDTDLCVAGALLHDVGKVDVYTRDGLAPEMTPVGMLHGEVPLTYNRVRLAISTVDDFPPLLADALLHIIVSHHGRLEWGSPVLPCTREASLVHCIDMLAARMGSFDRLEAELPEGERWTGYDRALGGRVWFGEDNAAR